MDRLGRRFFLQGAGVALATFGLRAPPAFALRALGLDDGGPGTKDAPAGGAAQGTAPAQAPAGRPRVLVVLMLPGALDGLSAVVPLGDPALRAARPALLHPEPGQSAKAAQGPLSEPLLPLESGLGLHPSLAPLLPLYREGALAFVHAVGLPGATRSHFDAQDFLDLGTPGVKNTADGWLSRALQASADAGARTPLQAVALSQRLPRSLQGGAKAFAFGSLASVKMQALPGDPRGERGRSLARDAFEALYARSADPALAPPGQEAFEAVAVLERKLGPELLRAAAAGDGGYPRSPLGRSLRQVAALIHAGVGLRVGCASVGGWDTHANQPAELSRRLADLSAALAAFWADLGDRRGEVVLVAATEFGRTVRQNGALGTDHGTAGLALLLGGRVAGGKVHGRWPGLSGERLFEGRDLAITTDVRAVLLAAARAQLGVTEAERVFPGFRGEAPALFRG